MCMDSGLCRFCSRANQATVDLLLLPVYCVLSSLQYFILPWLYLFLTEFKNLLLTGATMTNLLSLRLHIVLGIPKALFLRFFALSISSVLSLTQMHVLGWLAKYLSNQTRTVSRSSLREILLLTLMKFNNTSLTPRICGSPLLLSQRLLLRWRSPTNKYQRQQQSVMSWSGKYGKGSMRG